MSAVATSTRLLVIALPFYFVWEILQVLAFNGMAEDSLTATLVSGLATLGNGALRLSCSGSWRPYSGTHAGLRGHGLGDTYWSFWPA